MGGLVPRSMQSSGQRRLPATPCNVATRVRHRQSTCEKQCQRPERNACRRGNVETRAWHRLGTCGEHCQSCMERVARAEARSPGRVRVAPYTESHRSWNRSERDPRGSGQHCFKEFGRQRSCSAKRHAGSTAWGRADGSVRASAGSTARTRVWVTPPGRVWNATLKLDRPMVQCRWPKDRRKIGVTVPSLIETICELL